VKRARLLTVLLAAVFAWGVVSLFNLQFESGEVYPEYSSLRADPLGSKLLFDTLSRVPGVAVSRNFAALDDVEAGTTVLLLGWRAEGLADDAETLRKTAARGIRVVVAIAADANTRTDALAKSWGLPLAADRQARHSHNLYFPEARDWTVVDQAGTRVLALEKTFAKGAVAIWSESDDFANESTAAGDRLDTIAKAIGPNCRIVFDERHFGIAESGSVIALARRFRLTGMALGLGLCAALLLWRNASAFPPPAELSIRERLTGRTSQAGLVMLLRRNIPRQRLAAACWDEWLAGNRREARSPKVERAAAIVRSAGARPLEALREVQSVLQAKGEL
jgi:hypothetical protein